MAFGDGGRRKWGRGKGGRFSMRCPAGPPLARLAGLPAPVRACLGEPQGSRLLTAAPQPSAAQRRSRCSCVGPVWWWLIFCSGSITHVLAESMPSPGPFSGGSPGNTVSENQRLRLPAAGLRVPVLPRFIPLSLNHSPGHVLGPLLLSSLWVLSHTMGVVPAHPSRFGELLPETHEEVGVARRAERGQGGRAAGRVDLRGPPPRLPAAVY